MADITLKRDGNDLEFNKIKGTDTVMMHKRKRTYYKTISGVRIPSDKKRSPLESYIRCDTDLSHYHDVIDIPTTVFHHGFDYPVVALEAELMLQATAVTQVSIPGTVEKIPYCAFLHCTNLKTVILNEGIKILDDYAFSGCPFIHDIVLPDSIVQLTNKVFLDCENLTTVTLGENLKLLGAENFQSCPNITSVTCKAEIPPTCINPMQFTSWVYDNAVLKVSQFAIDKYRNAPGWSQFKTIEPMYVGRGPNDHPQWTKNDYISD